MTNSKSQRIMKWAVKAGDEGLRVDRYISTVNKDLSRLLVTDYILRGAVRINKHVVDEGSETIRKGDIVFLDTTLNQHIILGPPWQKNYKIRILFMDAHFIVVEKQAGLLSVPNHYKSQDNAVYFIRQYLQKKQKGKMPLVFYVHRLDKDTSGLMIFARHREAQKKLKDMISDKKIKRKYLAIIDGKMDKNAGKLVDHIAKEPNKYEYRQTITDPDQGLIAITHYRVRKRLKEFSLVEFSLETGRTHQIRIQMQNRGHAIMGDKKYRAKNKKNLYDISRLALHAYQLEIPHPISNKLLTFQAPLPFPLKEFIRKYS